MGLAKLLDLCPVYLLPIVSFCVCVFACVRKYVCMYVCVCYAYARYGHFSGINRKVQLTHLPNGQPKASSEEEGRNTESGWCLCVCAHYAFDEVKRMKDQT